MAEPWKKYAEKESGPWARYQAQPKSNIKNPEMTYGERLVQSAKDFGRDMDDIVRSVAAGATFNLADEIAAAGNTAIGQGDYESNLAAERARDAEIPPEVAIPGQIAGGLATGSGMARAGLTLLKGAKPTIASMATRGGVEGAGYGTLYGFGGAEGGFQDRAEGAAWGAFLGALTGSGTGAAAGRMAQGPRAQVPTSRELKKAAVGRRAAAVQSGAEISERGFSRIADDLADAADDFGYDRELQPKVARILKRFDEERGKSFSMEELFKLRKLFKSARSSGDDEERALGQILARTYDDALEAVSPNDVVAGSVKEATEALRDFRALYTRSKKGETIDKLVARAQKRAGQYSGNLEDSLRTEFRQLAMNEKKMRLFTKEEQRAIELVGEGKPIGNAMRFMGRFAPTGLVSGSAGIMLPTVLGPVGAVLPAAGIVGRAGATLATQGRARAASELMRAGGASIPPQASPAQVNALRALLIAESQQGNNALSSLRSPGRVPQ